MKNRIFALALFAAMGATQACEAVDWLVEVQDLNLAPGQVLYMAGSVAALGP